MTRQEGINARKIADMFISVTWTIVNTIFAIMMLLVLAQVIDRFVPGPSVFWTEEVVRILLVWSVMLGLPVVIYRHEEIAVDLLGRLPSKITVWRLRCAVVLSATFLCVLAYQGWVFTGRSANFTSPTLGLSRAWIYAALPIGAALGVIALAIRNETSSPFWPGKQLDDKK